MAQTSSDPSSSGERWWSLHFQTTVVAQHHGSFPSLYSGRNSLRSEPESKFSVTATVFLGARLWTGASLYFDPELTGGEGFSNVTGVAAFPNGEIYRIGGTRPTVVAARLYLQQAFNLGGETEAVEEQANQVADSLSPERLTIRLGKFSLTDFFDDNRYAHDPREQFLSWALMGNGAWDYAADVRGYTWGVAGEYLRPHWAIRAAAVMEPRVANGAEFDTNVSQAHALNFEVEHDHLLFGRPGATRLILYRNLARMGNYLEAIALSPAAPTLEPTRRYGRDKNGIGLSVEQEVADDAGLFFRLGWNDGRNETWAFTEIDGTATFGASWGGRAWGRSADRAAAALIVNGLSADHRDYLAHGGYGFIIGDGALRYGPETAIEAYYSLGLIRGFTLTADLQHIVNPAYNRDRGPVDVLGLRLHLEF